MNLLCIDTPNVCKSVFGNAIANTGPDPELGNEYTSYDECQGPDGIYYFLIGFPNDYAYHSRLFATLPNSSADEMQEQSREAIINLETVLV